MAKQMLNVGDGSTSTQQAGGKCLSQIMRGNVCNSGSILIRLPGGKEGWEPPVSLVALASCRLR